MSEMDKIKKLIKTYDLQPCKSFSMNDDNEFEITYGFDNGLLVIDALENDEDFKSLNLSISSFCEKTFDMCQLLYNQNSEFFID